MKYESLVRFHRFPSHTNQHCGDSVVHILVLWGIFEFKCGSTVITATWLLLPTVFHCEHQTCTRT